MHAPSTAHRSTAASAHGPDAAALSPYPAHTTVPALTESLLAEGALPSGGDGDALAGVASRAGDARAVSTDSIARWGLTPHHADFELPCPSPFDPWPSTGVDEALAGLPHVSLAPSAPPTSSPTVSDDP